MGGVVIPLDRNGRCSASSAVDGGIDARLDPARAFPLENGGTRRHPDSGKAVTSAENRRRLAIDVEQGRRRGDY